MIQNKKIIEKLTNKPSQVKSFEGMKSNQVIDLLNQYKPLINQVLPKHLNPERILSIATNNIIRNPKLAQCTIQSVIGGIVMSSILGLELIPQLNMAYLVPFKNGKTNTYEAVFMIGYKGLKDLAYRTDKISIIYANPVFENDVFEYKDGLERYLNHIPNLENPGELKFVYAVARFKDGTTHFVIKTKKQIESIRKRSKAGNDPNSPWANGILDDYIEMAKKTVIRALVKDLPITFDLKYIALDNQVVDIEKFDKNQTGEYDLSDLADEIIEDNKNYIVNKETGEVITNKNDKIEDAQVIENKKQNDNDIDEAEFVRQVKQVLVKQIQEENRKTEKGRIKLAQILKDNACSNLMELMNKLNETELQSVVDVLKLTNAEVESNENEGK